MKFYQLKIELQGLNVWRRVVVPGDITFYELKQVVDASFGWSSYHEYVKKSNLIDTSIILHYFNDDVKDFLYFHKNYKSCLEEEIDMEMIEKRVLDDDEAIEKVKEVLKSNNFLVIQTFDIKKRDEIIYQLAQIPKIGKKQLARILGVTERMIYRAIKNKEKRI